MAATSLRALEGGTLQGAGLGDPTQLYEQYGPSVLPAVLRQQRVSGALQTLLQHGGENLKSPIALGANLLATALLNSTSNKDTQALYGQLDNIRNQQSADLGQQAFPGAQGGGAAPPQAGPPAAPVAAAGAPQIAAPNIPINPLGATSAADVDALAKTGLQEDAQSAAGRKAVADVVANRALAGNMSIGDVLKQPGQFEVRRPVPSSGPAFENARSGMLATALGLAPDTTGGATSFFGPKAQAALGRPTPSWAAGQPGQMIGGNEFFKLPFAGQAAPPPRQLADLSPGPTMPPGQNVSAVAPGPPGGQGTGLQAGVTPPAAQGSPGGSPPPVQAAGPPTEAVPPQLHAQWQHNMDMYARTRIPAYREQADAIAQQALKMQSTPVDTSKPYWGPDGKIHDPNPYTQDTTTFQNKLIQKPAAGGKWDISDTGQRGSPPAGWEFGADGSLRPILTQAQAGGQPGAPGAPQPGQGKGAAYVGERPPMSQQEALSFQKEVIGNVKDARDSSKGYQLIQQLTADPNAISVAGIRDFLARYMTGGVARIQQVHLQEEGQSILQRLNAWAQTQKGKGPMPTDLLDASKRMMYYIASSEHDAAQPLFDAARQQYARSNDPTELDQLMPAAPTPIGELHGAPQPAAPHPAAPRGAYKPPPGFRVIGAQ